mmetsp:Transcript_68046/g.180904  ORF Transcript_68046/g.180904 Transcript_68046/m.180904 type:complete len:231 (+) Transcript_68046:284-976(+)
MSLSDSQAPSPLAFHLTGFPKAEIHAQELRGIRTYTIPHHTICTQARTYVTPSPISTPPLIICVRLEHVDKLTHIFGQIPRNAKKPLYQGSETHLLKLPPSFRVPPPTPRGHILLRSPGTSEHFAKTEPLEGVHTLQRMVVERHTLNTVHGNPLYLLLIAPEFITKTHSRKSEIVGHAEEALTCHGQTIIKIGMSRSIELRMDLDTEHIHRGNSSEAQNLGYGNDEVLLR